MAHINTFIAYILVCNHVTNVLTYLPYKDQAKLLSQNGHLFIESAEGGNITLRTRGSGYINVNNENLLQVTYLARKAATAIERFETESLTEIQSSINSLTFTLRGPMLRRLERLETFLPNSTTAYPSPINILVMRRKIRILIRRINMLSHQMRLLRRKLVTDECATNPCKNGGTCYDLYNGYRCICTDEWEGPRCETDVDECETFKGTELGCQNGGTCQNKDGGYNCICPSNWFGLHCTRRVYDCVVQDSTELCGHGVCINQGGTGRGFKCICDQGWTTTPGTGTCTLDIDECAMDVHPCSHDPPVQCVNLPGSFKCNPCPTGYSGNGYQCADIDECLINNGGCSTQPRVQCINTRGSYLCGPCPPGYSGDGTTCEAVSSLCEVNNGGCNEMATCVFVSSLNYVQCRCLRGWTGSGIGPYGCTRIANTSIATPCMSSPCLNGGTCYAANNGHYICRCLPVFGGPTCNQPLRSCAPNPCKNGGTCIEDANGQYTCRCVPKYSGTHCEFEEVGCSGQTITNTAGIISWPPTDNSVILSNQQSFTCSWRIVSLNASQIINIKFTKMNIPKLNNSCTLSYLEIHDGRTSAYPKLGRYCGTKLPSEQIISSHREVEIIFKSNSNSAEFSFNWTAVPRVCGGTINASRHGVLSSPGSPGLYPHNADCVWKLMAPPGKRIQIIFFTMDIEADKECAFDYLEIMDGTSLSSPLLKKFCNQSQPEPVTTHSNSAILHFHTDSNGDGKGFQLSYRAIEGQPGCGGILTSPLGRISPPMSVNEENTYEEELNCEWKIQLPLGEKIKLDFMRFSLEASSQCKYDYLAVYDGPSTDSELFGKWCGSNKPASLLSSSNILTIVFVSDYTYNEGEFLISYISVCGGHFTDPTGIVKSPFYPNHYPGDRVCMYLIELAPAKAIKLQFLDVDIEEDSDGECLYDYVKIYDGNTDASPLITEFCGNGTPGVIISKHNFLYLVFTTDETRHGRGFYANYSTIDIDCGGILTTTSGFVSSPRYPNEYPANKECHWIIVARAGYLIQLTWIAFNLEGISPNCVHDWLSIYDNTTTPEDSKQIGSRYCGKTIPPSMTSASNLLTIVFHTDDTVAEPGFIASYSTSDSRTACGGNYFASAGYVRSPNYPDEYPDDADCSWTITVMDGRQIRLNVIEFNMEKLSLKCIEDFLEIRNGGLGTSPLIDRYCGDDIPKEIISMSNQLYLRFVTDSSFTRKGFLISWESSLRGCGGILTGPSGNIISPNYPSPYGQNADCIWQIFVSQGSLIKLIILDMDLEDQEICVVDYLEVRDGGDKQAHLLGKFCKESSSTLTSTANNIYLRFRSDMSIEGRGFHLKYMTDCNRTLSDYHGVIESPNFPNNVPSDMNCNWIIKAPKGNSINITFSHFNLVDHPTWMYMEMSLSDIENLQSSSNNDSCQRTFIKIAEGSGMNAPSINRGKFCGRTIPTMISSTLDHVYIQYNAPQLSSANNFRLEWVVSGCGGYLSGKPTGTLSSPGYPNGYTRAYICEWYITVNYGKSIKITIDVLQMEKSINCTYDSLQVFGGADSTAPLLVKRCDAVTEPIVVHTSGNKAFIRFVSDASFHGIGFHATYATTNQECGGKFIGTHGQIHSHNYPQNYWRTDDCFFLIGVERNLRIVLNFTDFDIFSFYDNNCNNSYVAVYDGDSIDAPELGKFCGNRSPQPITSTSNQLFVRHKADGMNVAKGFIATYYAACGTTFITDSSGIVSLSEVNTPLYHDESITNCTWVIKSTKLDSKITLTFVLMDIGSTVNSSHFGVSIYAGEDSSSPFIGSYSGRWNPPPILVPSSSVTLVYKITNLLEHFGRFIIHYSILDTACGGNLRSESGTIVSPSYPDNYPANTECVWTVTVSPGNSVVLEIVELNIDQSESCNNDYLEVREKDHAGKLVGVYCGTNIPNRLYTNHSMWIKFRSSEEGQGKGFKAHYSLVHGGELTGISGQIANPLYPDSSIQYGRYTWRITVRPSHVIRIVFTELFIEKFDEESSCSDEIIIYDGFDNTARILKRICGTQKPEPFTTGSNVAFIVFSNFYSLIGSTFLIDWIQVPKHSKSPNQDGNISVTKDGPCSTTVELSLDPMKNVSYYFHSPGFPTGYANNLNCEWIFKTDPQNHIEISFRALNLDYGRSCVSDYITLYQGSAENQWDQIAKICHENDTLVPVIGNNLVKALFHTDYYFNRTGFSADAIAECGGSVTGPYGVIKSTHAYNMKPCQWNITVKAGQTIFINITKMNIFKKPGEPTCKRNYILFRDGGTRDSPLLGAGKYCGNEIPIIPRTNSNRLYIYATPVITGVQFSSFELEYQAHTIKCGRNIILSKDNPSAIVSSPNYPNVSPSHTQCVWSIMASSGETIHFDILERFDMTWDANCAHEYLELREGATEFGRPLGKFCNTPPKYIITEGNALYVKYFTDVDDPKDGFKARVSLSKCGGTLHGTFSGEDTIVSPGYPESYDGNLTCVWRLKADDYYHYKIRFKEFNLGGTALKHYNDSCNDGIEDTLTITDIFEDELSSNKSRVFCGQNNSLTLESGSNNVAITFKSLKTQSAFSKRKFSLRYELSVTRCGGNLNLPDGEIKSPGYPLCRKTMFCIWRITVPKGRRVTFTIDDFDLDTTGGSNLTMIGTHTLSFYSDHSFKTRMVKWDGSKEPGTIIESSSNKMLIYYALRVPNNHRGFIGRFSSLKPQKCGGDLVNPNGTVELIDLYQTEKAFYCEWEYVNTMNTPATFSVYISGRVTSKTTDDECYTAKAKVAVYQDQTTLLGEFCSKASPDNSRIITTPHPVTRIVVMKSSLFGPLVGNMSLTFNYKVNKCGGVLQMNTGSLVSPGYPNKYPPNLDCTWLVIFEEESLIKVTFNSFNLESDCNNDYLVIHNGDNGRAPQIGKYCGNMPLPDIISASNTLWFTLHSNDQIETSGFNLSLSPVQEGCGGTLHGASGQINSLNYPSPYANNLECDWEIRVDFGFHIGLSFPGRFFIERSDNCTNDYLEISDFKNDEWKVLGRVCGRKTPQSFNSTSNRMRVYFRTNNKTTADGFMAVWNVNCGGVINSRKSGVLYSPGYPNGYVGPLDCNYVVNLGPNDIINGKFEDFDLEETSTVGCTYDKVVVYTKNRGSIYRIVGTYCGDTIPPEFHSRGSFMISFTADSWTNHQGFALRYTIPECGGDITEETEIISPSFRPKGFFMPLDCKWNITAPKDKIITFRVVSRLSASRRCRYESIRLWNGDPIRRNNANLIATICGEMISQPGLFRTKGNRAVLEFNSNNFHGNKNFSIIVTFSYGESAGCGGDIELSSISLISNPKILGDNAPVFDCHWNIVAPDGNLITLTFQKMEFPPCNSTCKCDKAYIELFDGPTVNNELIGKYCGRELPGAITSSRRFASVRLVSDGDVSDVNFIIKATAALSPCGKTVLNVTTEPQELTSPNYPNNYPANIHCKWLLVHAGWATFDLYIADLDIEPMETCSSDRLQITEVGRGFSHYLLTGSNPNEKLIIGYDKVFGYKPSVFMGSRSSYVKSTFCGEGKTMDYYSSSDRIQVSFVSDAQTTAKGFKIIYRTANCSRNYTDVYGRILQSRLSADCTMFIRAPFPNGTISLYFNDFSISYRQNCSANKLKIYDAANSTTVPIATMCGYKLPSPIFSTGPEIILSYETVEKRMGNFDITYMITDQGRGCGGKLYNYGGIFSSPLYPGNVRKFSSCRWDITVPVGSTVTIEFQEFDLGPPSTCASDFLFIYDYYEESGIQKLRVRYCGGEKPAKFEGATNSAIIVYKTSVHNGGSGWLARFMAKGPTVGQMLGHDLQLPYIKHD